MGYKCVPTAFQPRTLCGLGSFAPNCLFVNGRSARICNDLRW